MNRLLASRRAQTEAVGGSPWLNSEFVACYARWRQVCLGARDAYERWTDAEPEVESVAYEAYVAALDREEHAAHVYRECADRVASRRNKPASRR